MSMSMSNMANLSSMDYRSTPSTSTTVLRRGQPFFMAVRMKDRNFDPRRDILRASFSFGISSRLLFAFNLTAIFIIWIDLYRTQPSSDQGNQSGLALPHDPARVHPSPAKMGHPAPSARRIQHHFPGEIQSDDFLLKYIFYECQLNTISINRSIFRPTLWLDCGASLSKRRRPLRERASTNSDSRTTSTSFSTRSAEVKLFRCLLDVLIIFLRLYLDDPVFLDSEDLRREYLMNETGKVFVGTHNRPKGRRWVYGQFSDVALPVAQLLLEQSGLNPTERGNPVQVVRAIASIVIYHFLNLLFVVICYWNWLIDSMIGTLQINANDGFGLLEGKWEGSFEDGVCPWVWTGSSKIFEHYLRNGSKPVKYGQCWVFSAVATSSTSKPFSRLLFIFWDF